MEHTIIAFTLQGDVPLTLARTMKGDNHQNTCGLCEDNRVIINSEIFLNF